MNIEPLYAFLSGIVLVAAFWIGERLGVYVNGEKERINNITRTIETRFKERK